MYVWASPVSQGLGLTWLPSGPLPWLLLGSVPSEGLPMYVWASPVTQELGLPSGPLLWLPSGPLPWLLLGPLPSECLPLYVQASPVTQGPGSQRTASVPHGELEQRWPAETAGVP